MKNDAGDGHDGRAAGQDDGHGRKRPATLEKKKERDGSGAHADAGNGRIGVSLLNFLVPSVR